VREFGALSGKAIMAEEIYLKGFMLDGAVTLLAIVNEYPADVRELAEDLCLAACDCRDQHGLLVNHRLSVVYALQMADKLLNGSFPMAGGRKYQRA
jgi:hypothetical protein